MGALSSAARFEARMPAGNGDDKSCGAKVLFLFFFSGFQSSGWMSITISSDRVGSVVTRGQVGTLAVFGGILIALVWDVAQVVVNMGALGTNGGTRSGLTSD